MSDEQALRRAGEGALLGDHHEVLELAEVHTREYPPSQIEWEQFL